MSTLVSAERGTRPRRLVRARRPLRVLIALTLALLLLAALGEALLPGIATSKLRSSLQRNATDVAVKIEASPALELLLGRADRVTVHMRELRSSGHGSLNALLARTAHAARLDATVGRLFSHGLEIEDVSLQKRGDALALSAAVTTHAIRQALPSGIGISPTPDGQSALNLRMSVRALGHELSETAHVDASDGRLEISPASSLLQAIHITLFSDPRVSVDSVHVTAHDSEYLFSARGHFV
jgi:hypothetical protein